MSDPTDERVPSEAYRERVRAEVEAELAAERAHPATLWDVHRDGNGEPITITEDQMYAVWHAMHVVEEVRRAEGCRSLYGNGFAEFAKSRLLGRMLLDGKPPYDEKPPSEAAACAYWFWDEPRT